MTKRFCPKCGASITEGVFCEDCVVNELHYEAPIIQISEFSRTIHKGRWRPFDDLKEVIKKRVQEALGKKIPIELDPFSFEPKARNKIILKAHAIIDGKKTTLPVRLSYMQCDFGQKEKTAYYEGILQLRNTSDSVFEFIERELKKVASKGAFITQSVETKTGVDLYITNKSHMRLLAQKIHAKFGGTLKLNPQLFSHNHQTSKDIYRLNILMELPSFHVGDVVFFTPVAARRKEDEKKAVLINRLGKIMHGKDLFTGKGIAFEFKFAKDLEVAEQIKTTIAANTPDFLVLDPETFQAVPIVNHEVLKEDFLPDDEVYVAKSKHGLIVVKKA